LILDVFKRLNVLEPKSFIYQNFDTYNVKKDVSYFSYDQLRNMEDIIILQRKDIRSLKTESRQNREAIRELNRLTRNCLQKIGVLKYDAFEGMGGKLSFALCILDYRDSGYILNSIHSRETTFSYIKIVENGQTDQILTEEERIVLEQALGYRER